ncbi:MAG TPA: hypothetical protein VJ302_28865 [Blastocatellia bacterium]|nr:hypothetical protein [Blastocatellia bacterium]
MFTVKLKSLLACLLLLVLSTSLGNSGQVRAQGLDNPLPLKLGETNKLDLFENEESHLKISLPAGRFKIILDTRRSDWKRGGLFGQLSILNSSGVVEKPNVIRINVEDIVDRGSYGFSLKSPSTFILKLTNYRWRQMFWLTVLKEPLQSFLPLVGEITPKPLTLGQTESGTLDRNEYIFYTTKVRRGDYNVALDLATTSGRSAEVYGDFYTFDSDGANRDKLFSIIESSAKIVRKTGTFAARGESMMIFKVCNYKITQVNYKLIIKRAELEGGGKE